MLSRILLFFVLLTFLVGCSSKRYASKAKKFDEAGLFADAASLYFESVVSNPNNIEAKLGLQRNGQLVLTEKLASFKTHYNNSSVKDAVYSYIDAEKYFNQLKGVGVKLLFPAENSSYFDEVKEKYLEKLYSDAMMALDMEQFESSASMLAEIMAIDKNYKDVAEHYVVAVNEPLYRDASQYMAANLYRKAYAIFSTMLTYKDAGQLRAVALEKGTVTVAAAPFTAFARNSDIVSSALRTKTMAAISNSKSPFLKVVTDAGLSSLRESAFKPLSVQVNEFIRNRRAQVQARTILVCNVVSNNIDKGTLRRIEKTGYLRREVSYRDSLGAIKKKTEFEKVRYQEFQHTNSLHLTVEFSLIDVATGNVVVTDHLGSSLKSSVNYASYQGETKNLVPGYWVSKEKNSTQDRIYDSEDDVKELRNLLQANRTLRTEAELQDEAINELSRQICLLIERYNPEA